MANEAVITLNEQPLANGTIPGSSTSNEAPPRSGQRVQYTAGIFPGPNIGLSEDYGDALHNLAESLGMPVWVLASDIERDLSSAFRAAGSQLPAEGPIALVITSRGGDARAAYEIGRQLQRAGGFVAVVPDLAMSAATLLTLAADRILMAGGASLGPLDVQIYDKDLEEYTSGLNEVQALERLRAYALDSIDETMFLLTHRMDKRTNEILPHVLRFVADTTRPLFESIDVVHYSERARILRVAEGYATRLLASKFPSTTDGAVQARMLAGRLVETYPEHGFMIDAKEAAELGLEIVSPTDQQAALLEHLWAAGRNIQATGPIMEMKA